MDRLIKPSSNLAGAAGLQDSTLKPWKSAKWDSQPSIKVDFAESNTLVTELSIAYASNVASITLGILAKNGSQVIKTYSTNT